MSPALLVRLSNMELLIEVVLAAVMLTLAGLKQGLQEGISELRLMWESPRVQWMVEEGRRGRRRMRRRQGRRSRVEISIVVFSMRRPNFV